MEEYAIASFSGALSPTRGAGKSQLNVHNATGLARKQKCARKMIASAYKSGDGPSDVIPYKYLPKYDERAYDQPT